MTPECCITGCGAPSIHIARIVGMGWRHVCKMHWLWLLDLGVLRDDAGKVPLGRPA